MAAERKKREIGSIGKAYLLIYNLGQLIGWSLMFGKFVGYLVTNKDHVGLYKAVEWELKIFQTGAVLEILHCALGLVPSSVILTAFQVYSRVFLLWGIVHSVPDVQDSVGVPMFLCAWSITEIIRYGFYSTSLIYKAPSYLLWCRYSFFLILYPLGVSGELVAVFNSLPFVKESGIYSISLPNKANVSFSYYYYLIVFMIGYLPVFPQLFGHMLKQRKKFIGAMGKTD